VKDPPTSSRSAGERVGDVDEGETGGTAEKMGDAAGPSPRPDEEKWCIRMTEVEKIQNHE